jgi:UrcA family protein
MKKIRAGSLTVLLAGLAAAVLCGGCNKTPPPAPAAGPDDSQQQSQASAPASEDSTATGSISEDSSSSAPAEEVPAASAAASAAPAREVSRPRKGVVAHVAPRKHPAAGTPQATQGEVASLPPPAVPPDEIVVDVQNVIVEGHKPPADIPSRRVRLSDLDLSTVKGACTALHRIETAAGEVCPFQDEVELSFRAQRKSCVNDSVTRAVQSTRSQQLESLRAGQGSGC